MSRILLSTGKYVQGAGALKEIGLHAAGLGSKALAIGGTTALALTTAIIRESLENQKISYTEEIFNGVSSHKEIQRLEQSARRLNADLIIAVGGGAAIDAGKAVSHALNVPVIVVPTTAATDGPCSALCVIYDEQNVFQRYLRLRRNPDCVLMDTQIIANAPVRFLIAGMGDAVASYWESRSSLRSGNINAFNGGSAPTLTVRSLAELCYTTLLEYGTLAVMAVDKKIVNPALEAVVEANTLISGLCSENGGHAAAHSIHNGLTALDKTKSKLHGEKVAFGLLAQIILEGHPRKTFQEVQAFCYRVGLPVCLADLDLADATRDEVASVARRSVIEGETIHTAGARVTADQVAAAIWTADELGKQYKRAQQIKQLYDHQQLGSRQPDTPTKRATCG
ncbi:glycerol dehydrogenase [Desulfuromonas thiophila]|uniref:glycerol dehydrogenase n=1 Tax=Desulfuromonas thiophila TaxID=57664 RepID=UPI0029F57F2F|nr:glycerol dehydrogenase [Desulfuromonas thiophila]